MVTTVFNPKNIIVYFLVLLCATLFYSHKFVTPFSDGYQSKLDSHKSIKKERTKAILNIIESSKGTKEYETFINSKTLTDKAWKIFLETKKDEKVFGFKSLHFFLERFGLTFLILVYSIFNLIRSFYYDRKNFSSKVFHTFVLSVGIFNLFWIFNTFQDFSKLTYLLLTIFSACFVTIGLYIFTKYKQSYINSLKGDIREISRFTVLNTKPGKQKDMFNMFEKLTKSKL